jgi:hypothetical protein
MLTELRTHMSSDTTRVLGSKPRPRALIWGLEEYEEAIARRVGTAKAIDSIARVRPAEWDCLFAGPSVRLTDVPRHLSVVKFCTYTYGALENVELDCGIQGQIRVGGPHVCTEFYPPPEELEESTKRLVVERFLPLVRSREDHLVFSCEPVSAPDRRAYRKLNEHLQPFLRTATSQILAGRYMRAVTSDCWLLPEDASDDALLWIDAALRRWNTLWSATFPLRLLDWERDARWQTLEERRLVRQLHELSESQQAAVEGFEDRRKKLQGELGDASSNAANNERLLLTAKSDELKDAVNEALTELGYIVTDVDEVMEGSAHLEDLDIRDPDDEDWVAIVEVRGYNSGAALNDLLRLGRFAERFRDREGRGPSARWYVVNQFVGQDPGTRPPVLDGNDKDFSAFVEDGGMLADTADLFRLLMQVRAGELSADEARAVLRATSGRLNLPER